jgi:hypothetical protein
MRQTLRFSSILLVVFVAGALIPVGAQTANHTVTVRVSTITLVQVSSGTVNMSITGALAVAGQDLMSTTNQATSLLWGVNSSSKKVTIRTSLGTPKFTLKADAVNPTQGLAAGQVTITPTDKDFLLNIGRSSGNCVIRYTGEALASQGTGTDPHTITFTIVTQ